MKRSPMRRPERHPDRLRLAQDTLEFDRHHSGEAVDRRVLPVEPARDFESVLKRKPSIEVAGAGPLPAAVIARAPGRR